MAMYTAVLERTREVGILKAVGASPGFILDLLVRETSLLSILGTIVGILLTYGSQWLMKHAVPIQPDSGVGLSLVAHRRSHRNRRLLLGVIVPAIKAMRQDATEALSYE